MGRDEGVGRGFSSGLSLEWVVEDVTRGLVVVIGVGAGWVLSNGGVKREGLA